MADLGDLLALLHDGPDRVRRLRAEIVKRADDDVSMEAFRRRSEASGGVTMYAYAESEDEEPEPRPEETRVRIWIDRDAGAERAESEGREEGLSVRRGGTWWSWDPHNGAMSNEHEEVDTDVARDARWILGGLPLLATLRLSLTGAGEVAGRPTIRCRATTRPPTGRGLEDWVLHDLPGYGADAYEIDVDARTGLIVRVAASLDGDAFAVHEVVDLGIDEPFDDELFTFESPDGSAPRSFRELHGEHHFDVRPDRLLELAPFTVFTPRRVPDGWEARFAFTGASEQPGMRATVFLNLSSDDNLRTIQIHQVAADDAEHHDEWDHDDPAPWQTETRDGIELEWREANADWQPARVRLTRDGTRILVDSRDLPAADLLELAAGLVALRADRPDF